MPHALVDRVRAVAGGADERRMFGSLAFFVGDRLALAVQDDGLLVRVGSEARAAALAEPGVTPAVMGTREMRGWVRVDEATLDDDALRAWWERAVAAARRA